MLGIMRKYQKSVVIKIVFGLIVLSFIGTIFLVWGKGGGGKGDSSYAAKVDGTVISYEDYRRSYFRLRDIYQQLYGGSLTPEMEKGMGLKKVALDGLIDEVLLRKGARKLGVDVSKKEVVDEISKNPAFQSNGAFDFDRYNSMLRSAKITPKEFEGQQKEELFSKKVRQKIKEQATVSDEEVAAAYAKENDKVNLLFAGFSPADAASGVKLSDQDLQMYLDAHKEEFRTPEQISVAYVFVPAGSGDAAIQVTPEEAEAFYRKNMDRFQGKEGILPFNDVKDKAVAEVRRQKAATVAYEKGVKAINAAAGNIETAAAAVGGKVTTTPLFTAASPAPALASEAEVLKKAFSLKTGELGGPVETAKGMYILKVADRKQSEIPPLASVHSQVEPKAKAQKAAELAKKMAEDALARMSKGDATLKLSQTGPFGYKGKTAPGIGASPELVETAFALTAASPVAKEPIKVGDRWYALKLKERIEASREDLAKVKEQLKQTLLPAKQEEALKKFLKDAREQSKIEINQAVLAD